MRATTQRKTETEVDQGQNSWNENPGLPKVDRVNEKGRASSPTQSFERPKTTDDALKIASSCLEELNEALKDGKSQAMENYLSYIAKFHTYSANNTFLIQSQCPHATIVAGYEKWQELGRQVQRNEEGIAIIKPRESKRLVEVENEQGEIEQKEVKKRTGFFIGHVFDISQTKGEDVPSTAQMSGEPGEYLPRLEAIVDRYGIQLDYDYPSNGALGVSQGGQIQVRPDLDPVEKFAVLTHELAHELLHKGERRNETSTTVRETEAEAVAFVVSKATGLDCSTRSSDYIALYQGDSDVLKESLNFIQKTASKIIWGLQQDDSDGD